MKMRLIAVVAGAIAFLLPALASADTSVKIGNLEKRPLKFSLRCTGAEQWHTFSLGSTEYKSFDSTDWSESCNRGSYELRIGTTNGDGSVTEKIVPLEIGQTYALVKPGSTNDYTAYDIRRMVVVANQSSRKLAFTYHCSGAESHSLSVAPNDFTWIYAGSSSACSPLQASIDTDAADGSKTTLSRPLALENIYMLSWNAGRQAWDIQVTRQGGGAAASSDAN